MFVHAKRELCSWRSWRETMLVAVMTVRIGVVKQQNKVTNAEQADR